MLRLTISVGPDRREIVAAALAETEGVNRLIRLPTEGDTDETIFIADVMPPAGDSVMELITDHGIHADDYLLTKLDVIAPFHMERSRNPVNEGFAWVEIMGQARANSRPLGRYLTLISVAGVIAAMGVLTGNTILIVGAMAVSPDLLPICATCVGMIGRRWHLARRAFVTLLLGLGLVVVTAFVVSGLLNIFGFLGPNEDISKGAIGRLAQTDYSTILVALAAGVAAILAFETRASAAVGVAISVTTIPASAYIGVAVGIGESAEALGALVVLAINVSLLIVSGVLTLAIQRLASPGPDPAPRDGTR